MSHASHRNAVLDPSRPLAQRASHARSCAIHVANRLRTTRNAVIAHVLACTGIDLHAVPDADTLLTAFHWMEALRSIDDTGSPCASA